MPVLSEPRRETVRIRHPITVRYAETDAMGVVHHSSYVPWLEAARVEWLERIGQPYPEIERRGIAYPVVELGLTYRSPARFGDKVEVEVWLAEVTARTVRYQYRIWRGEQLLAEGFTRHLVSDSIGKAVRMPTDLLSKLSEYRELSS